MHNYKIGQQVFIKNCQILRYIGQTARIIETIENFDLMSSKKNLLITVQLLNGEKHSFTMLPSHMPNYIITKIDCSKLWKEINA